MTDVMPVCFTDRMAEDGAGSAELDDAATVFTGLRPKLFGIAYRMLGSVTEAEDMVQNVWIRWQGADRTQVRDPAAFLVTTTTRLCINELQSARARRETYVGPWLPEPVDTTADPALGAVRDEALEFATLELMEKLPPPERAAYILRHAFDYPYELIGETITVTPVNARQLVSRARKHLTGDRRQPVSTAEHSRLLTAFVEAAKTGDMAVLEEVLAGDVVSQTDGNGARYAARTPVFGSSAVAAFVSSFPEPFWHDTELQWTQANGRPAVVITRSGVPAAFLTVQASSGGIEQIFWILNVDKLAGVVASRA